MVFLRPSSSSTNKNGKGNNCSHCDLDKNTCDPRIGKCIPKDLCDGKEKPDNICNYVCFKNKKWVCDTYPCVNSYLPEYPDCSIDQLKCDNSYLYCQGVTGCNGGNRYYYGVNHISCICPTGFKGPNCKFSNETCNNVGIVDDKGNCNCDQPYYGDKCQNKCGPTGPTGMYVYDYDNDKCICGPSYELKGENCILRKCHGNGTLDKDVCVCDGGWTGTNCETSICNVNQIYDETTKTCICKPDDINTNPYNRYHSPECTLYHCNLESEYKNDGTCDCKNDSCGTYCQYTKDNSCNGRGKPNCKDEIFTSCVCDGGWTGTNCQCQVYENPIADNNKCKGISSICGPTGWEPHNSKCKELYDSYGNQDEWSKSCIDQLFPDKFYIQTYKNGSTGTIGSLSCDDDPTAKDQSYICTDTICLHGQGCPNNPTGCTNGQVNICDSNIAYNWQCLDQRSGQCDSASIGNVCKSGNPAECFNCGTLGTSELVCTLDGGTPSINCIGGLGIEKIKPPNYPNGIYIDNSSGGGGLPIYPTTSKKECSDLFLTKSSINPYSIQTYTNPTILNNPVASYNSDNKSLTDLTTTSNLYFYPNLASGKEARCILDQTDLMTYLNAPGSTLCNSNGQFIQNATSGQFTLDSNNSPGVCSCKPGFAGNNCQFSDSITCSGKGNVDNNGICKCFTGFAGKNCQFSDSKDCNNNGYVNNDGVCYSCKPGFTGNNCEFLTGYYCNVNGQCEEGKLSINEKNPSFFTDKNTCLSTCIPKYISVGDILTPASGTDMGFGCNFGNNAIKAYDACNGRTPFFAANSPRYNWYCNPEFDNGSVKHNGHCDPFCICSGTAKNTEIYKPP